jgi:hypothetical protein
MAERAWVFMPPTRRNPAWRRTANTDRCDISNNVLEQDHRAIKLWVRAAPSGELGARSPAMKRFI